VEWRLHVVVGVVFMGCVTVFYLQLGATKQLTAGERPALTRISGFLPDAGTGRASQHGFLT
jgi:hypothetical protein